MGIGVSILIIAVGAILSFGITREVSGLDIDAIGVVLMLVGILGLIVSALFLSTWSPFYYRTYTRDRYVGPADHDHARPADHLH